jgi:serine-type D-Ala-D-Ala endopeptidase (penicillin-binding protein 7)
VAYASLHHLVRSAAVALLAGSIGIATAGAGAPAGHSGQVHHGSPNLKSHVALVIDEAQDAPLYAKHQDQVAPIASITKLMTAMVVLDAQLPLDEAIEIDRADATGARQSRSRLPVGAQLTRGELLRIALMSSVNRAAAALARTYPGGTEECVAAMNRKAEELGMTHTRFSDPTGLSSGNVSTAEDLSRMVLAAAGYPDIREATTTARHEVTLSDGRVLEYHNSNGLVSNRTWSIGLSKTGYINAAGRCLVMQAEIAARHVVIVLLDSWGKYTRLGDANRIRHWIEATLPPPAATTGAVHDSSPAATAPGIP